MEESGTGARNLIFGNYDALVRFHPPGRQPAGTVGMARGGGAGGTLGQSVDR